MKRNKKILLTLGTLASVAAPVAAVVSCGTDGKHIHGDGSADTNGVRQFSLLPTYTGQADQLIALGIHADYYPEQLNVDHPYDYLTNPGKYMTKQSADFKSKFQTAVAGMMPKTVGESWWNQDAQKSDDKRIDNTYWQKQQGSVLLYEHYLLDDDAKVIESNWAPKHQPQTAVQTNFRASRDPYTRIPKGVFFGWDLSNKSLEAIAKANPLTSVTLLDTKTHNEKVYSATEDGSVAPVSDFTVASNVVTSKLNGADVIITQDSAKIIISMRKKRAEFLSDNGKTKGTSDWFYNDWFFVDSFHRTYLDNKDFQSSKFAQWMLDSTKSNPFEAVAAEGHTLKTDQENIQALFDASTFQGDEVKGGINPTSRAKVSAHHPIYEQQDGNIGAAPMFEGAMRDNQLYLFNVAWQIQNLAKTGTPYGQQYVDSLPAGSAADSEAEKGTAADFSVPKTQYDANLVKKYVAEHVSKDQLDEMSHALDNANLITDQLHTRMTDMKSYLGKLGVNGKTFGLLTIAPGKGVSTLQTTSKFSFIYNELGFAQPTPKNLSTLATGAKTFTNAWTTSGTNPNLDADGNVVSTATTEIKNAIGKGSIFNMDDNGWFWTLGDAGKMDEAKIDEFKDSIDLGVVASRDLNFGAEIGANAAIQTKIAQMFKGNNKATAITSDEAADFVAKLRENADYDLWNEGLKTPFVMHMLLDQIITKSEEYFVAHGGSAAQLKTLQSSAEYKDAINWGQYFTSDFLK